MKTFFILLFCTAALGSSAQFVSQPLNYPAPGYWPYYISVADPLHVWVGTIHEFAYPYSVAVHTADGGNTWIFDSIPVPGIPNCTSIASLDSGTCYYVFTDGNAGGGSIWKTTDQGETWADLTTTQFTGGFANFCHPFSADTAVAMGDPVDGYFEILLTFNGGTAWERVPSSSIPPPLPGEYGFGDCYSAVGNSVWFTTNMGRCYRSSDRGMTWAATQVINTSDEMCRVCFSTEEKGAYWSADANSGDFFVTTDGGATWTAKTFKPGYMIMNMSRVNGFEEGYVLTAWKNTTSVHFTPDMFQTSQVLTSSIVSSGALDFLDASTGWLSGGESGNNEIYKYTGILTAPDKYQPERVKLAIMPNPTSGLARVLLPTHLSGTDCELWIYHLTGALALSMPVPATGNGVWLDGSGLENGLYLVRLIAGGRDASSCRWVVAH